MRLFRNKPEGSSRIALAEVEYTEATNRPLTEMNTMRKQLLPAFLSTLLAALVAVGCGDSTTEETASVTVYSGRSEALIGPLLERFEASSGIVVEVRYGSTSEMTATLLEEGENTPADLFISQDAAALGALSGAGMLHAPDPEVLGRVSDRFRSSSDDWIGISGRARVVVYNTDQIGPEELPQSLWDVGNPQYKGRFGVAPGNGSFQAHMAAVSAIAGPEKLADWLLAVVENDAQTYSNNSSIVNAVLAGEIDWGLVNHYYLWRAKSEDPSVPGANFFMPGGDISGFINVAGAGLLSDSQPAAQLLDYLLSADAQTYFAEETYEYPLIEGVSASVDLLPLDEMPTPEINFAEVSSSLVSALEAISASGLLP